MRRHTMWALIFPAGMALLSALPAWGGVAEYTTRYDYLCTPPTSGGTKTWDLTGCCDPGNTDPTVTCDGGTSSTTSRNIVLVVSDDHDYCQFGFMAGVCSQKDGGEWVSCNEEDDCASGRCVGTADLHRCTGDAEQPCLVDTPDCTGKGTCNTAAAAPDDAPLRLNDLACRNRQPHAAEDTCTSAEEADGGLDSASLRFSRGNAPCDASAATSSTDAFPVVRTPHLDALAKQAAIFPRAYVAGTQCKNSRRTMMHGRYSRHLQWLWNGGKGRYEESRTGVADPPKGCTTEGVGTCEAAHTLGWWPIHGEGAPPDEEDAYLSFAFAKTENMKPGQGGFHALSKVGKGVAKVKCKKAGSSLAGECQDVLQDPDIVDTAFPTKAMFDVKTGSLFSLTEAVDQTIDQTSYAQTRPFFLWFGPHIPHDGPKTNDFEGIYDTTPSDREREHYKRVTWLDSVLGGLVYHLQRACRCDSGNWTPIWDNTVLLFLSDQGWLLPNAKFNTLENTQRTPVLISAPELRDTDSENGVPAVFERELASAVDLLPTIMDYADVTYFDDQGDDYADEYPHGRTLRPVVETGSWSTYRRNLTFGEQGRQSVKGNNTNESGFPRYVLNRPGLFGVCSLSYPTPGGNHRMPCRDNDDCCVNGLASNCLTANDYGTCILPGTNPDDPAGPKWKRCVNRPYKSCSKDADCVPQIFTIPDLCNSATGMCRDNAGAGSFKDFVGKSCAVNTTDCVPPGVCRPIVLKVEAKDHTRLTTAWDIEWDPDQEHGIDLTAAGNDYLGVDDTGELRRDFWRCLKNYAKLDPATGVWVDEITTTHINHCPSTLGNWR